MKRTYKQDNVLQAAKKRVSYMFDEFQNKVQVNISGGKDSTVIADLCIKEAVKRGVQISCLFLDQEAEYENTIRVVRHIMSHPNVIPMWYQVPFRMTNSVSFVEPFLNAWSEGEKDRWMRDKDPIAIHEINEPYADRFYDFFPYIEKKIGRTASVVGLRSNESLNRYRSVIKNPGYKGLKWTTKAKGEVVRFYPIYDWGFDDVWKYIYDEGLVYNRIYDFQWMKDYGKKNMRVSYLMHEHSFRCLCDLPEFEPKTFERLCNRISGIDAAMRYGKEKTMYNAETLPKRFSSWLEFRDFLLEAHPNEKQRTRFEKRFKGQLSNESVYRRQVGQLLINDYEGGLEVNQTDLEAKKKERKKKIMSIL